MEAILKYLEFIPAYATDIITLISSPKIFLNSRNISSGDNWHLALRFFGFSVLLSGLIQHFSIWQLEYKNANFLLTLAVSAAINIVGALFGTVAIKTAWKFVGGRAQFDSTFLTFLYIYSVFILWTSCTSLAYIGIILNTAPAFYSELIKIITHGGSAAIIGHFLLSDPDLYNSNPNDLFFGISVFIVGFIIIFGALIWIVVTWGAYRTLNNVSRARSFAAFIICGFFFLPVYGIMVLIDAGTFIHE